MIWSVVLLDAICTGLAITFLQFALTPSLIFLMMLIFRLIEFRNLFFLMINLFVGLLTAFISADVLGISFGNVFTANGYYQQSSALVRIASIVGFTLYIAISLNFAERQVEILKKNFADLEVKNTRYIKIANKIARYVPSQVWQAIANDSLESSLDIKRKKLTIFFSDIEGFTELSETLSPDDLAHLLNTYFDKMSNIAKKYGGTIDKFVGDALVIFFGDPTTKGTHADALACIDMAIAMQNEMKRLRQKYQHSDFVKLHVRMGVTTGYCHVGNFGSASRMSYTIIGKEANIAARLQSAANPDEILITDETFQQVKTQIRCVDCGEISLRGIAQPLQTWQVQGRYESVPTVQRRWIEFDLDGFNMQLDLDLVKAYDKEKIKVALKQVAENLDRAHDI
ncbi:MAG: adenylate/guanylate cyclase domain-containing protein [Candidatus Saccharibacteria bacterium]|nr:adenylate/guanylate cyclase domain-containing protein [Moraxellaceae bacterium]